MFATQNSSLICIIAAVLSPSAATGSAPVYPEHQDLSYYINRCGTKCGIQSVCDWRIRRRHILANMQRVMGPLPKPRRPVPLAVRIVETKTFDGFVRKKITYHTDSKVRRVSAYLFLPTGDGNRKRAAVLCLHQTTGIGKKEPAGIGGKPNLYYALHLAKRGYVTLAPDYPSFGDDRFDFAPRHGYLSGTMKAVYDNIRAVDLLQSLPQVDPRRIGCIGHSLGGHNTMFTAAFEPRIKVLVSNCGFTRFHKYYGGKLRGWTSKRYMPLIASRYGNDPNKVPFDFTEIVAAFAPRPFLAGAPLRDSNFEVSGVKDVIAAAKPIYRLYCKADHLQANYPDCAHDFPPDVRKTAYEFLDKHLRHTPRHRKPPIGRRRTSQAGSAVRTTGCELCP
ncbi:MAG: alpha/beta hydrolase family protein [Planctomycetaceae bacterium]